MKTSHRRTCIAYALCLAFTGLIGFIDCITGWETSMMIFYLLPIIAAPFFAGMAGGMAMALGGAAAWGLSDWCSHHHYASGLAFVWNIGVRLLSFIAVAILAGMVAQQRVPRTDQTRELPAPSGEALRPYQNRLPLSNKLGRLFWTLTWALAFRPSPPSFHAWRRLLLRLFRAEVGPGCCIDPTCRVWAPWKLTLGAYSQLEPEVDCYSVDTISIGDRTIIGRGAYLCSASHDVDTPGLPLIHAPIRVGVDCCIGVRSFLRPGTTVADGGVVGACAVVTRDVEPGSIVSGNPARPQRQRAVFPVQAPRPGAPRVGIVTFHMSSNFGAVLQTYALQRALETIGCDPCIVDYRPAYLMTGGRLISPFDPRMLHTNAGIAMIKIEGLRARLFNRSRSRLFDAFRAHHLRLTPRTYTSLRELQEDPPDCDLLVCGSDQIWNPPPRRGVDPAFYLGFGKPGCRRASFAASFGSASVPERYRAEVGRWIRDLDVISVRERSGQDLVRKLAGRESEWTLDPALLFDDYSPIMLRPDDSGFLFSYCLRTTKGVWRIQRDVARRLGLRIVAPTTPGIRSDFRVSTREFGPRCWLGHIAQAQCAITNSFHGTVFCILFKRPFLTVAIQGRKQGLNERFESLLGRLQLTDRLVHSDTSDLEAVRRLEAPIDWEAVHGRLEAWRAEAWEYLRRVAAVGAAGGPSRQDRA